MDNEDNNVLESSMTLSKAPKKLKSHDHVFLGRSKKSNLNDSIKQTLARNVPSLILES